MEYRNAKFIQDGWIDCEINHPIYGWIPFTANPSDTGAQFDVAALHAVMSADPATLPYVESPPIVPRVVSRKQVRLLLLNQNLLDQVEYMISQQDKATQIEWQDSLEFHRDNPLLNTLAQNLGLTDEQIDQFFIAAAAL